MSIARSNTRPLVGRDRELSELRAMLEAASDGAGGTAFVLGDAGIGKTALASALADEARDRDYWVITGRVWPLDAGLAYAPIAQAVGPWLRGLDDRTRGALIEGLPEIARLLGDLGLPPAPRLGDPALEKTRLFEAMARLLERAAETAAGLLLLDDLHHADHGTVELLHYLMRRLEGAPFVLLATARSRAGRQPLEDLIRHAQLSGLARSIRLGPLDSEGLRQLTEAELEGRASKELLALLAERAGGAPFFTLALLRTLRQQEKLVQIRDEWRSAPGARRALPPEVRQLMLARLGALEPWQRTVLEHLAVGGSQVRLDVLAEVGPLGQDELIRALEDFCRRGVVEEERADDGSVTYALAHPLSAEVVVEQLSVARRRKIHERYLQVLGESGPSASLAWHVRGVGPDVKDPEGALEVLLAAGRDAMENGAFEDAVNWLAPATELARRHGFTDRLAAVLEALGACRTSAHNLEGGAAAWTEALALRDARGDVEAGANLRGRLAITLWELGRLDEAITTLRDGVARLEPRGPSAALARLYQYCFVIGTRAGDTAWMRATADALEAWGEVPEELAFSVAAAEVHRCVAEGRLLAAVEVAKQAATHARNPTDMFIADRMLIGIASVAGIHDDAAEEALRRAQLGALAWMGPSLRIIWGSRCLRAGDLRGAVEHLREAMVEASLPGVPRRQAIAGAVLVVPLALQGRFDEARAELDEARRRLSDHLHDVHMRSELEVAEVVLAMESGETARAAELARNLTLHEWGVMHGWFQAEALWRAGDPGDAARAAAVVASRFHDLPLCRACELRIGGLIRASKGERAEAFRALGEAVELLEETSAGFFAAQARLERAEVAASSKRKKRAAIADGRAALTTFEESGAERYAERARQLLRKLGEHVTAPRRTAEGPLSARELEVARLAAGGKTNAVIGRTLFISPHTAATHMKNIYSRTGVRNRAALGEWLRANDLLES